MDELLRQLLDSLDAVGEKHEEIYDTVCREAMGRPIFYLFIKRQMDFVMPDDFGLFSEDANARVKTALVRYIETANELASKLGMNTFHQRLAAFQNEDIFSTIEGNFFDDFFGWRNPTNFDRDGNVIDQA